VKKGEVYRLDLPLRDRIVSDGSVWGPSLFVLRTGLVFAPRAEELPRRGVRYIVRTPGGGIELRDGEVVLVAGSRLYSLPLKEGEAVLGLERARGLWRLGRPVKAAEGCWAPSTSEMDVLGTEEEVLRIAQAEDLFPLAVRE